MATKNEIFLGTELKLNIHIEPIDSFTMDNYNFHIDVFVSPKKVVSIPKSDSVRIDENNYIVLVDTSEVGAGDIIAKVVAEIPDSDFKDGLRTEVVQIQTGITVVK